MTPVRRFATFTLNAHSLAAGAAVFRPFHSYRLAFLCALILGVLLVPSLRAQTFPPEPAQRQFIQDEAALIHAHDAQQIKNLCDHLLTDESIPIIVVTIPSLAKYDGTDIASYARALFDHWGIGSQKLNYGVLVLVSLGDRKARIELGAGWGDTKNETTQMIMDDIMIPSFKKGDYSTGILRGVRTLESMARGHTVRKPVS
jgi:uncharacterized protein